MTTPDSGLLPSEAERLAKFVGEWKVEGSLTSGGLPAAVSGTWRFEQAANGWGVRGTMNTEIDGMGAFEEAELIGFDSVAGRIHLFSMNKYAIRDHIGDWLSAGKLAVEYAGVEGDVEVTEEIAIEFMDLNTMVGSVVEHTDGVIAITTDLTLTKQG